MKRIACGLCMGLLLSIMSVLELYAQSDAWRFGVHFDPTVNWFYSDTQRYRNEGAGGGFLAGLEVEYEFAKQYAVMFGVDASYWGGTTLFYKEGETIEDIIQRKYNDSPLYAKPGKSKVNLHFSMLNLPVGLKFRAVEIGYVTLYAALGGMMGVPLTSKLSAENLLEEDKGETLHLQKEATRKYYTPVNAGVFVRLGVEYSLGGRSAIEGGVGYQSILSRVVKPGRGRISAGVFQFRVGFVF